MRTQNSPLPVQTQRPDKVGHKFLPIQIARAKKKRGAGGIQPPAYTAVIRFLVSLALVLAVFFASATQTLGASGIKASGLPNTSAFGFGAQIDDRAGNLEPVVTIARQAGFDWFSLEFDWTEAQPAQNQPLDLANLRKIALLTSSNQINLMISIKNPPAWALTPEGPAPALVAGLVGRIAQETPNTALAFEIFPGANKAANWGAAANPAAYTAVLQSVESILMRLNPRAVIVPSIMPLSSADSQGDMDDLDFLARMYADTSASARLSIVGISYEQDQLTGEPAQSPAESPAHSLRHYEQVREVMKNHNHADSLIWITSFTWPASLSDAQQQANWVYMAYKQLQGQLFIGAAFFKQLNPAVQPDETPTLLGRDLARHPAIQLLQRLTGQSGAASSGSAPSPAHSSLLESLINTILSWFGNP